MSNGTAQTIKELMSIILNVEVENIYESTSIDSIPSWDSSNQINLILALEEEFSISFDVSEFESMVSYLDILQVVSAKI